MHDSTNRSTITDLSQLNLSYFNLHNLFRSLFVVAL